MSLDGGNGALQSRAAINGPRDYPDIVVADIDVDGSPTILTANDNGQVTAYTGSGAIKPNWPVTTVADREVRSLSDTDLDRDGRFHAFWLSRTEHGNRPFDARRPGDTFISDPTEPAVAERDLHGIMSCSGGNRT